MTEKHQQSMINHQHKPTEIALRKFSVNTSVVMTNTATVNRALFVSLSSTTVQRNPALSNEIKHTKKKEKRGLFL